MKMRKRLLGTLFVLLLLSVACSGFLLGSAGAAVVNPGLWDFSEGLQNWISNNPISTAPLEEEDGAALLEAGDVSTYSLTMINTSMSIKLGNAKKVRVTLKNQSGSSAAKFYFLAKNSTWNEAGSTEYLQIASNDGDYVEYEFDFSQNQNWGDTLKALRFDVSNAGMKSGEKVFVKSIEIVGLMNYDSDVPGFVAGRTLYDNDLIVANFDVTKEPFGAKADGETDDTAAIQSALDYAGIVGGGIVFLPAGDYLLDGVLTVPQSVTLRGVWISPLERQDQKITVLHATYAAPGNEKKSVVMLGVAATVLDLAIDYPLQGKRAGEIVEYPYAITHCGFSGTSKNITLFNAYNGIDTGFSGPSQHVFNIYGTILNQGIYFNKCLEVGNCVNIYFSTKIWADSGLANAPEVSEREALRDWTKSNAVGIRFERCDDCWIYNISVDPDEYKMGIYLGFSFATGDFDALWAGGSYGNIFQINNTEISFADKPTMGNGVTLVDGNGDALDYAYSFADSRSPVSERIYNILDFGGVGNGELDNSGAYKRLMDEAVKERNPGGTVFFPAGVYLFANPIKVPSGFELRGVAEGVSHVVSQSMSMLLVEDNKTTLEQSFVQLSKNSGIHGFRIVYRRQSIANVVYDEVVPYKATILGRGENVWVENCSILNAYDAIDFSSNRCDNFVVNGVWGTALNKFLTVGAGSKNGRVEHVFNTFAVWMETSGLHENRAELESYFAEHSTSYEIGKVKNLQMFSVSSFGANIGIRFLGQKQDCDDVKIFRALMDNPNSEANLLFEGGKNIKIFGLSSASYSGAHIVNSESFRGNATVYGLNWWASYMIDAFDSERIVVLDDGAMGSTDRSLVNLAKREGVAFDCSETSELGGTAESAVGRLDEFWRSRDLIGENQSAYFEVKLAAPESVREIRICFDQFIQRFSERETPIECLPSDFVVSVSADGREFFEVLAVWDSTEKYVYLRFDEPLKIQSVRIECSRTTGRSAGEKGYLAIGDFAVFGGTERAKELGAENVKAFERLYLKDVPNNFEAVLSGNLPKKKTGCGCGAGASLCLLFAGIALKKII